MESDQTEEEVRMRNDGKMMNALTLPPPCASLSRSNHLTFFPVKPGDMTHANGDGP